MAWPRPYVSGQKVPNFISNFDKNDLITLIANFIISFKSFSMQSQILNILFLADTQTKSFFSLRPLRLLIHLTTSLIFLSNTCSFATLNAKAQSYFLSALLFDSTCFCFWFCKFEPLLSGLCYKTLNLRELSISISKRTIWSSKSVEIFPFSSLFGNGMVLLFVANFKLRFEQSFQNTQYIWINQTFESYGNTITFKFYFI